MRIQFENKLVYALFLSICFTSQLYAGNLIIVKKEVLPQHQFKQPNSEYIIRDDIDLGNKKITIPNNCILKFEGGSLKNGTIVYSNTYIEGRYAINCKCSGTLANDIVEPQMYGARGDGKTDDSRAIQQSIKSGKQVLFRRCTYLIGTPIVFDGQNSIVDFNFATLKKTSKTGFNYKFKEYDFNHIPCVVLLKPYESNTTGHIVLKNLIIDGGNVNCGVHAIWCRNVIIDNVRIYSATQGIVYKGFTNTFRDITVWASNEGFVLLGGNATLLERCFSTKCGWRVENVNGATLVTCSSDDFNPCYKIINSSVSMVGCTFESKGLGIEVDKGVVNVNGDFECHIYDETKVITYIKAINNSVVNANGCFFHLNNYLKKKIPYSPLFECVNNSNIQIEGKISHPLKEIQVKSINGGAINFNGSRLINGKNVIK